MWSARRCSPRAWRAAGRSPTRSPNCCAARVAAVVTTPTTPGPSAFASYVDVITTPSYPFETPSGPAQAHVVLSFVVADPARSCTPARAGLAAGRVPGGRRPVRAHQHRPRPRGCIPGGLRRLGPAGGRDQGGPGPCDRGRAHPRCVADPARVAGRARHIGDVGGGVNGMTLGFGTVSSLNATPSGVVIQATMALKSQVSAAPVAPRGWWSRRAPDRLARVGDPWCR